MKKFLVLLKKEIIELLTPQMIIPFVIVMIVFSFIGDFVGKQAAKQQNKPSTAIMDEDKSTLSQTIVSQLGKSNMKLTVLSGTREQALQRINTGDEKVLVIIPPHFEEGIQAGQIQKLPVYTVFRNFSVLGATQLQGSSIVVGSINEIVSNSLIAQHAKGLNPAFLKAPISLESYVTVGDKQTAADPNAIFNYIMSQTAIIPVIIFLVITLASQLVATAIATEKENKTLETLLSAPINRKTIVASKLIASGLVSLAMAVVYMFGMQNYANQMSNISTTAVSTTSSIQPALHQLGLVFTTGNYIMLGITMFLGILVALSLAFILGGFAEDARAAQTVIAPVMVMLLIPYFLSLLADISSLSLLPKILISAIPFTHIFTVGSNIMLHNYTAIILGDLYLLVVFIIAIIFASKIFTSEKILTMKLNFSKKK